MTLPAVHEVHDQERMLGFSIHRSYHKKGLSLRTEQPYSSNPDHNRGAYFSDSRPPAHVQTPNSSQTANS